LFRAQYVDTFGDLPINSSFVVTMVESYAELTEKQPCLDDEMMASDDRGVRVYVEDRKRFGAGAGVATVTADRDIRPRVTHQVSREYVLWQGIKRHVTARH
jgi:hypothetical protein